MSLSKLCYPGRIPSESGVPDRESAIAERVCQHYSEICKLLNPVQLLPYLWKEGLLNFEDRTVVLGELPRLQKSRHILKSLKTKGSLSYSKFLQCIQMEKFHMGHSTIGFLVEGKSFGSESELFQSQKFREEIVTHLPKMMDINLASLIPLMYNSNLLTLEEHQELLSSHKTERERILLLFQILETKGPLAHDIFAQCLREEPSHPTHMELFKLISTHQPTKRDTSRKRKNGVDASMLTLVMPDKRLFQSWKMQGCLKGRVYNDMMRLFQSYHHNGEWGKLDCEAEKHIAGNIIEFQAVALLEKAIGWIFRKNRETVVSLVEKARLICLKIPGENSSFLLGRCEYILSRLFRYLKEYAKAREHVANAREHLYLVEPGEDSSFVNYCDACIMVECLHESSPPEEIRRAQATFKRAIDDDLSHESGLGLVAPHSLMRLAQMYLGGTHYDPGITTNVENIKQAKLCLQAVDCTSLCHRSQCHYHLIQSDLYRNTNDFSKATESIKIAQTLAQKYNFVLEISAAETRLKKTLSITS